MKKRSLKTRIQKTFIIVLILPVLILALVAVTFFYHTISDATFEENQRRIRILSDVLENEIKRVERHVVTFAKGLDLISANGEQLSNSIKPVIENHQSIYEIKVLNEKGIVQFVEPYNRNEIGRDLSYATFVRKTFSENSLTWSTSYLSPTSNTPVSSFAIPIVAGAIVVTFDISQFTNIIKFHSDNSVKIAIVDKGGVFLSHTDHEKYQQRQWEPNSLLIREHLTNKPDLEHYVVDNAQQNIILGNMISDTGLMVILYQNRSEYLSPIRKITIIFAIGLLLFLIPIFFVSIRTSNYFFSYISDLSENIHTIAKGDYKTNIDAKGFKELIRVNNDFEDMVGKIDDREKKIQSLNTELKDKLAEAETAIRQKNKAEDQLHKSHDTLLAVLNGMDSTIYVADMQSYEILFINKYMADIYGADLVGTSCFESIRGHKVPCPDCPNEHLLDENGTPTDGFIWENTNPISGKIYINHDSAIRWIDGRIVRMQIATDVSEMKELEDKLKQAQKMEAIGTLAGGIAHDFNNILSAIIGYCDLAIEDFGSTSKRLNHDLNQILSASQRAADLVKQILQFSRKSDRKVKPVSLQPIINEAIRLLRSIIPATIDFHIDLDETIISRVNPTEFHQIIMNLCTNAYHAMRVQGGELSVELRKIGLKRNRRTRAILNNLEEYCEVVVKDTGQGIPPELQNKIFEPYFTSKSSGEGTGLGLAVVHGLVKSFDGEILVESDVNSGTTFKIYLPLFRSDELKHSDSEFHETDYPRGNEKIVIVDDDEAIVTMNDSILSSLGYSTRSFNDSEKALEYIINNIKNVDLVITDMTMPKMTGLELFKATRKVAPHLPVILSSGYSDLIDQETAISMGIKDYLFKPLRKRELALSVRNTIDEM